MTWHTEPLLGFDLETTGINVETARIVTAALVTYTPNGKHSTRIWIADPGVAIPEEAAKIHGYDTARARAEGRPAVEVVEEVAAAVAAALAASTPVVAMNARFDFSVLDRELRRYQLRTLWERLGGDTAPGPVIDPFILDKQADKFRRGSRKLEALAVHYGVTLAAAHTSDADALAAVQVAVAIGEKYPELQVDPQQLHVWQVWWARQQAAELQAYLQKSDPYAVVDSEWPLVHLTSERKFRGTLADLAERWGWMASNCNDESPELAHGRAHAYRKAAADIRDVLRTGLIPHDLMTNTELEQHGASEEAGR